MTKNIYITSGKIEKNLPCGIQQDCKDCEVDEWSIIICSRKIVVSHPQFNRGRPVMFKLMDGVLNLRDDGKRHYCYFRSAILDKFMRTFRLDTIVNENPDKEYFMNTITNTDLSTYYAFFTDGSIEITEVKSGRNTNIGCHRIVVKGATFVYYKQVNSSKTGKRAISYKLHTKRDAFELKPVLSKCLKRMQSGCLGAFTV